MEFLKPMVFYESFRSNYLTEVLKLMIFYGGFKTHDS